MAEFSPHVPFLGKTDVFEIRYRSKPKPKKRAKNLFVYLYDVISSFLLNRVEYMEFPRFDVYADENFEMFNFSMTLDQKLELYRSGYFQACERGPVSSRNDHASSEADSKTPSCSHECIHDQADQSEDQHRLEDDDSGGKEDLLESQSSVPQEKNQSDLDTFSEISHSDWGQ